MRKYKVLAMCVGFLMLAGFNQSYAKDVIDEHLILHLDFNEGSGNIVSGKSAVINDGAIHGNAKWVEGRFGKALEFDGVDDYVQVPNSESLETVNENNALTLEAWAYFDLEKLKGKSVRIIDKTYGAGGFAKEYFLAYRDAGLYQNALRFGTAQDWSGKRWWIIVNDAIENTGWHHIIATYDKDLTDGKRAKLYVDGKEVGSLNPTKFTHIGKGGIPLLIGGRISSWKPRKRSGSFIGRIDEVKIWSKALSYEEIKELYGSLYAGIELVSPSLNEEVSSTVPAFTWTSSGDKASYILELSQSPAFKPGETTKVSLSKNSYKPVKPLESGVWYWRVWVTDKQGKPTGASEARAFIVDGIL